MEFKESSDALQEAVDQYVSVSDVIVHFGRPTFHRYNIRHTFAFATKGLIAQLTFPLAKEYVDTALLHGQDAEDDIEGMLDQCYSVGRHTNIIWIRPNQAPVRFAWTESVVRPWGQTLPYQCPACFSVFAWDNGKTKPETGDITFRCKGFNAKGRKCQKTLEVKNTHGLVLTKRRHMGKWRKGAL